MTQNVGSCPQPPPCLQSQTYYRLLPQTSVQQYHPSGGILPRPAEDEEKGVDMMSSRTNVEPQQSATINMDCSITIIGK